LTEFAGPAQARHAVQFYEDEEFLVGAITRFTEAALRAGEGTVVIATRAHLDRLRGALGGKSAEALEAGRVLLINARDTLEAVMVDGTPDRALFRESVGPVFERCRAAWGPHKARETSTSRAGAAPHTSTAHGAVRGDAPRLRAFGEMVNLLCKDGNLAAALRLEELWSETCQERDVSTVCGYAMSNFPGEAHSESFDAICARHDGVVPSESFARLDDPRARQREIAQLQQRARSLDTEVQKRKELELELRHARVQQRRAEHTSRVRDELLAAVAQELRPPLKVIAGWTALLRSGKDLDVREAAQTIERSAQVQGRLLEDVTDASRIVGGTLRIRPGPVDLAFVLRAAVERISAAAAAKHVQIEVRIDHDPCLGHADVHRIEQVLASLLSNALRHTPEGGKIEASLARTVEEIEFSVRDNGEGIETSALAQLFERLRRIEGRAHPRGAGMRLGLAVARHIVELHGGSIEAHSDGVDRGAIFRFRLPRRAALSDVG
jgi:signal transduction histidine kinase